MSLNFFHKYSNHSLLLKVFLFSLFFIANSNQFYSQEHSNFIHLTPTLNNKSIYINHTVHDLQGYIWMLHPSGIEKYDGSNYFHLGINEIFNKYESNDSFKELIKDSKQNFWITTKNGLVATRDSLGRFKEIESTKENSIQTVYTNNTSTLLVSKKGIVYKFNYNTEQLEVITTIPNIIPKSTEILSIVENKENEFFISTSQGRIYHYIPSKKALITLTGPFSNYPGNLRLCLDLDNRLWIGIVVITSSCSVL